MMSYQRVEMFQQKRMMYLKIRILKDVIHRDIWDFLEKMKNTFMHIDIKIYMILVI